MQGKHEENSIPKRVVKLEDPYDIKDKFKPVSNTKLQSSTLRFELINLGTEQNHQNINLGLGLSIEENEAFISLLRKNKHVFAWRYDDLKTYDTSIIQHTIPMLPEQKPVQQKLRKIHPNLEGQIKSELNKLLKAKIIFPVRHSNWVSNMVSVRKKNGDIRICIDFRNLNKASLKDNFPLPTMEQILQSVAGLELMSFLDEFSGYNQILVHLDDRLKTTFRTKWGTYAYQKIPFGLINAGATFQRAMDISFKGLINRTVVVYLDDITIFSKERSNHLHDLNQIFQRCKKYGISLNPKRSFFALDRGKLIGFIVSKDGIYINPDRIKEISEIPFPHNKKSMQSFLGQINFVKRFVPDFSQIILPLQTMIKKNLVFKWGLPEKEAFELIKKSIINAPALDTPKFSNHFTLYTIASDCSYAAVLTQINDHNLEAPISFYSSNLHGAELNYYEVEKQAFAVYKAVKHYRPFLLKAHTKVIIPFSSVRQLLIQRELGEKRENWVTTLQEYDLEIKPAKIVRGQGFCRLLAGASNIPESSDTNQSETINRISIIDSESQYADIIFYLKNGYAPPNLSYKNKRAIRLKEFFFTIIDDVHFRKNYDSILLRCLEKQEAQRVLQELHEGPAGGHFGADTIAHKVIHVGYYWPTLFRDAHEYDKQKASIGSSPFKLVYGKAVVLPTNLILPSLALFQFIEENPSSSLQLRHDQILKLEEEREKAKIIHAKHQQIIKSSFDSISSGSKQFQVGDLVLKWDKAHEDKGKHTKFQKMWLGPFQICEKIGHSTFMLQDLSGLRDSLPVNGLILKKLFN
eukprot:PITA_22177